MSRSKVENVTDDDSELVIQAISELPYVTIAYQKLIHRHYSAIYRTCAAVLNNRSDAEEACQSALMKIFNGLPRFEQRSSFKTWAIKIGTNTSLSLLAKTKLMRDRQAAYQESNENSDSPELMYKDSFESMVSELSEEEREILTLRFVGELSIIEIAQAMDLKLSATKMRFYRALEKLKNSVQ